MSGVAFNREYAFKQIESQTKDVFSQEMLWPHVWADFPSVAVECLDRFPAQIVASPSYILFSDCSQCLEKPTCPHYHSYAKIESHDIQSLHTTLNFTTAIGAAAECVA